MVVGDSAGEICRSSRRGTEGDDKDSSLGGVANVMLDVDGHVIDSVVMS